MNIPVSNTGQNIHNSGNLATMEDRNESRREDKRLENAWNTGKGQYEQNFDGLPNEPSRVREKRNVDWQDDTGEPS